jgi:hypothetical protein
MTKMSLVLQAIDLNDLFTETIRGTLISKIGSKDSSIFANCNTFAIAEKLTELGVEIDESEIIAISKYLWQQMKALEVFFETDSKSNATAPSPVTINFPKSADEKDLVELLNDINKNTSNLSLRAVLMNRPEVILARRKANYRPVFAGKDSMLDVNTTIASIKWLRDGNPYREQIGGCFLMELGDILDAGQIQFIHPIDGSKLPTNKIDEFNLDYSLIDLQVHKSYVWIGTQWNTFGPDSIKKQLDRMTFREIHQDMLSQGEITQQVLAKFTHACGSKSGALIRDTSIEWSDEFYTHSTGTNEDFSVSPQAGRYSGKKPIGGFLNASQLRKLFECLSANDIDNLVFDNFPEVRRNFTTGQTNGQRIGLMIEFAEKHLQVFELMKAVWKINPNGYDKFMANLNAPQVVTSLKQEGKYNVNIVQATGDRSIAIGDFIVGDKIMGNKIVTGDNNRF